jgi:hypothetical protein
LLLISPFTLEAQAIVQHSVAAAAGTVAGTIAGKKISDGLNATKEASDKAAQVGTVKKSAQSTGKNNKNKKQTAHGETPAAPVSAAATAGAPTPNGGASGAGAPTTTTTANNSASNVTPKPGPRTPAPISSGTTKDSVAGDDSTAKEAQRAVARRPAPRKTKTRIARTKRKVADQAPAATASLAGARGSTPSVTVDPSEQATQNLRRVEVGASRQQVIAQLGRPASRISFVEDGGLREIFTYTHSGYSLGSVRFMNGSVTGVQVRQ